MVHLGRVVFGQAASTPIHCCGRVLSPFPLRPALRSTGFAPAAIIPSGPEPLDDARRAREPRVTIAPRQLDLRRNNGSILRPGSGLSSPRGRSSQLPTPDPL